MPAEWAFAIPSLEVLLTWPQGEMSVPAPHQHMVCTFAAPSRISLDGAGLGPYSGGVAQHFLDLLFFYWKAFCCHRIEMLHGKHFCLQTEIINAWLQYFAHVCPHPQRLLKISSQSGTSQILILMFKQLFSFRCPSPWFILTNCPLSLLCSVETQADCQQPASKSSTEAVTTRCPGMMQSIEITLRR